MANKNKNKGAGIVEIIVGLSIVLVGVFALLKTYNYYIRFAIIHKYDIQAALLAEEGVEVVKLLRDQSYSGKIANLTSGNIYSIGFVSQAWQSTTARKYVDGIFDRTFVLADVYRDGADNISPSGTLDPGTKRLVVSVAYRAINGTTTKSVSTYITNLFGN